MSRPRYYYPNELWNLILHGTRDALQVVNVGSTNAAVFPDAAALADAAALPTTTLVGAVAMGYGGAAGLLFQRVPTTFKNVAGVSITAGTPQAIWTPATGKKFRLMGWLFSATAASAIIFKFGAAAAGSAEFLRTESLGINANSVFVHFGGGGPMPGAANDLLALDATANAAFNGFLFGCEET